MSQLVLRIGIHWKHWARKEVIRRGGPKPPPVQLTTSKPAISVPYLPPAGFGARVPSHYLPGPSLSAPVSARSEGHQGTRSEGHQGTRSRSPVPDLRAQVSAASPARSTKSE